MKSTWFSDRRGYELAKLITAQSYHMRLQEVWRDFIRMVSLTLKQGSNKVVGQFCQVTEDEILRLQERHPHWKETYAPGFAFLVNHYATFGVSDFLGQVYQELDAANSWHGQFFTPMHLCRVMARMTLGTKEEFMRNFEENPRRIRIMEPACGGGATLLGVLELFMEWEVPPSAYYMHAIDIDPMCVDMCYIQLSLLGAPATVHCANTLLNPTCKDAPEYTTVTGRMFPLLPQGVPVMTRQISAPAGKTESRQPIRRKAIRDR